MAATVIYDGDCGICTRSKQAIERLDWFGTMRWVPLQGKTAAGFGIPAEELDRALQLIGGRGRTAGFAAFKRIFARLPVFWILAGASVWLTPWALIGWAILFSPVSNPIGNRVYDWVARNRYRFPGSTCHRPF